MESPVAWLVNEVFNLYITLLIVWVVFSWLIAFDIINTRNRFVYLVSDFLYRITEPALRPIRRVIPNLGGIDISPVILILGIIFIQRLLNYYVF